jgi:hypothetical protein
VEFQGRQLRRHTIDRSLWPLIANVWHAFDRGRIVFVLLRGGRKLTCALCGITEIAALASPPPSPTSGSEPRQIRKLGKDLHTLAGDNRLAKKRQKIVLLGQYVGLG